MKLSTDLNHQLPLLALMFTIRGIEDVQCMTLALTPVYAALERYPHSAN